MSLQLTADHVNRHFSPHSHDKGVSLWQRRHPMFCTDGLQGRTSAIRDPIDEDIEN